MTKQRIALVIQCAPEHGSSASAFRLAQTLVSNEEATLNRVFFYGDGAYHALNAAFDWDKLGIDLGVCVASLQQRGDEKDIAEKFNIVGLGYLAELYQKNNKVIVFG